MDRSDRKTEDGLLKVAQSTGSCSHRISMNIIRHDLMEGDATHTAPLLGFCDLSLLPIPSSGAMASLEDRVFFITGTTSGIGEFTAGLLAKEIG